ncbi:hypothetical protein ACFQ1E_10010 [Sphingomonas canadensis]|uniref:Fucose-binding lectin protein n=1 Tax=Sphingomonas canadensis TaxID=1219257 RepID=A0ABW3H5M3_9SPHN|nr:hypothetical protein [Sphingomonas canadensis]MCW3836546.1 hypothetical protein [Sphingomonas canadensis]
MNQPSSGYVAATDTISWIDTSGNLHIRVYSSDGNNVSERCADTGSAGWTTGSFLKPGGMVSATVWQDSAGAHIRVYCTAMGTTTEWCSDPGTPGWTQGSYTPA